MNMAKQTSMEWTVTGMRNLLANAWSVCPTTLQMMQTIDTTLGQLSDVEGESALLETQHS